MVVNHRFPRFLTGILLVFTSLIVTGCRDKNVHKEPGIGFDDDGMLVLNGERKFIVGSYHLPKTDSPFKTLSTNGYNYVHVNNLSEMDAAQANGLYTWVNTGSIRTEKDPEDRKRITSLVNRYKDHPALLFWEIEDEPAFTWGSPEFRVTPDNMFNTYSLIKSNDAGHPVITNHAPVNLISTLQKYNTSTDVVSCDVYPVIPHGITPTYALFPDGLQGDLLNPYISQVGEYVDKMNKVVNNTKPVYMVLQGFAWEMLKSETERDTSMVLYPTYEQSRFMAYNAIIHGATGIVYWGTNYTPQPSVFIEDLNKVTRELSGIQSVLNARTIDLFVSKEYHERGYSVDTGVETMVKKPEDQTFMLTVNSDKNPVKVTFDGLNGFTGAAVLSENRKLEITGGKLTDSYRPFDVHIYRFE